MSENNGAGKLVTAEELLAQSRKQVELSGGGTVVIRRVGKAKLAQIVRGIPDVTRLARLAGRDEAQIATEPAADALAAGEAVGRMMDGVLIAGVVTPKLFADPEQGLTPADLEPEDQGLLFREILALSRFTREAGAEVLPLSKTAG